MPLVGSSPAGRPATSSARRGAAQWSEIFRCSQCRTRSYANSPRAVRTIRGPARRFLPAPLALAARTRRVRVSRRRVAPPACCTRVTCTAHSTGTALRKPASRRPPSSTVRCTSACRTSPRAAAARTPPSSSSASCDRHSMVAGTSRSASSSGSCPWRSSSSPCASAHGSCSASTGARWTRPRAPSSPSRLSPSSAVSSIASMARGACVPQSTASHAPARARIARRASSLL